MGVPPAHLPRNSPDSPNYLPAKKSGESAQVCLCGSRRFGAGVVGHFVSGEIHPERTGGSRKGNSPGETEPPGAGVCFCLEFTPAELILKFLIWDSHVCAFSHRRSEQVSECATGGCKQQRGGRVVLFSRRGNFPGRRHRKQSVFSEGGSHSVARAHGCDDAIIRLGQPPATFGEDEAQDKDIYIYI